jgi:hypothetical protein
MIRFLAALFSFCVLSSPALAQSDPALSLLTVNAEAAVIADQAGPGQEFLRITAHHTRVGILQNDIRGTGLVNSDRIVVPSGTPVFFASFGTSSSRYRSAQHFGGWCGVVTENDRPLGLCMFPDGDGAVLGRLPRSGSAYVPTQLADYGLRPITVPEVRPDESARQNLPMVELSYSVREWEEDELRISRVAIVGGESFDLGTISLARDAAGATFMTPNALLQLSPSEDGGILVQRMQK